MRSKFTINSCDVHDTHVGLLQIVFGKLEISFERYIDGRGLYPKCIWWFKTKQRTELVWFICLKFSLKHG